VGGLSELCNKCVMHICRSLRFCLSIRVEGLRKDTKTNVMIVSLLVKIQAGYLLNMKEVC
jgi:hypothetical protein